MSFDGVRSGKTTREIGKLSGVKVRWHYSDKRAGNENRHKMAIEIQCNSKEIIEMIQSIIKKNFPESFPGMYKGKYYMEPGKSAFIQLVWRSKREIFTDEIFKIVLEDKGCLIESVAG